MEAGARINARWVDAVVDTLKANDVEIVTYVPDKVLAPLIARLHTEEYFTVFQLAREEEGLGIAAGAWMGGKRSILLMQTSGFATVPNALASLIVACQIPAIMMISERGALGDHQVGQAIVCRTMRPVLESLGIDHHVITRLDETTFIVEQAIQQAVATQAPVALILSPLLTKNPAFK